MHFPAIRILGKIANRRDGHAQTESKLNSYYQISSDDLGPWISIAVPGSGDLFASFRNSTKDVRISTFKLDVSDKALTVTCNTGAKFSISWDSSLKHRFIDSPFPTLGAYAATARFIYENLLEINVHWSNGWFETLICFELTTGETKVTTKNSD